MRVRILTSAFAFGLFFEGIMGYSTFGLYIVPAALMGILSAALPFRVHSLTMILAISTGFFTMIVTTFMMTDYYIPSRFFMIHIFLVIGIFSVIVYVANTQRKKEY